MVSIEKIISYWYLFGSGTILGGFISGCNMRSPSTRICFIGQQKVDPRRPMLPHRAWCRRSPYKIDNFRRFLKSFHTFVQFRQKLVAIWCTSEKSAKLSYLIGYSDRSWANYARHAACKTTCNTGRYAGVRPLQARHWSFRSHQSLSVWTV